MISQWGLIILIFLGKKAIGKPVAFLILVGFDYGVILLTLLELKFAV